MKKLLFLSVILIPVFLLTACGNKEEKVELKTIEYYDEGYEFKTTFKYDPSLNLNNVQYDEEGKAKELEFEIEELNLTFDMYYTDSGKSLADDVKESRSKKEYYKEFNFNGHDAYCYGDYDDKLNLIINLKEDKNNVEYDLFISMETKEEKGTIVYDVLTQNTLQEFFNSIEFEETK